MTDTNLKGKQPSKGALQAGKLAAAIQGAIVTANQGVPVEDRDPYAAASALAHVTAMLLASVPDHRARKAMRKGIHDMTSRQLATFLSEEGNKK